MSAFVASDRIFKKFLECRETSSEDQEEIYEDTYLESVVE
jgi:hypothetical protein